MEHKLVNGIEVTEDLFHGNSMLCIKIPRKIIKESYGVLFLVVKEEFIKHKNVILNYLGSLDSTCYDFDDVKQKLGENAIQNIAFRYR
jgi:hypothetical protein